jgi:hypothetical protein
MKEILQVVFPTIVLFIVVLLSGREGNKYPWQESVKITAEILFAIGGSYLFLWCLIWLYS